MRRRSVHWLHQASESSTLCTVTRTLRTNILYTDKKENQIFLIYREIQSEAVAKSYMRKGFLKYEEIRKYFPIYEEAGR